MRDKSGVAASTACPNDALQKTEQKEPTDGRKSKDMRQDGKIEEEGDDNVEEVMPSPHPRKRKDGELDQPASPRKVARKDAKADDDQTPDNTHKGSKPGPTQMLKFLLSAECLPLTIPESERELGDDIRIYATAALSPFEELLSAVVLSRPISHRLGQRTIRTLLNHPYGFTSPGAVQTAGRDKVLQAVWDAKTQHKDKTADEIVGLADVLINEGEDADSVSLGKVRQAAGGDPQEERKWLKQHVKGIGPTGLDIFCRRVQGHWEEVFPFVDERTGQALEELGLPREAEQLRMSLEESWGDLGAEGIGIQEESEEQRKRRAFVLMLERAVGASLEKNVESVLSEAVKV